MPVDWERVRGEFPALANWTFLNTATFGQLPRRAVEAVGRHFAHRDELACDDFLDWFDDADEIRGLVARLVHCGAADVAFVPNAASALGMLMGGLDWRSGDRVVALEHEFPNNLYYPAFAERHGVEFIETPWERFYDALHPRTRLVLMSTANYMTGFQPPLEEVGRALRERGILFYLDGTQSVGAVRIDVGAVQPDLFAAHAYKWLLSPTGAGFLYVSPRTRGWLQPNVIGWRSDRRWRSVNALHHGAPEFVEAAEKYEGGMLNFPPLYAMGASLELIHELGPEAIERRVLELARRIEEILIRAGGQIAHPGSHIVAARFEGRDPACIAAALKRSRVLVSARHGRLRVSAHFYNNEADLERLEQGLLRALAAGG